VEFDALDITNFWVAVADIGQKCGLSGSWVFASLDPRKKHLLKVQCEQEKCQLSDFQETTVFIAYFHRERNVDVGIPRTNLETKYQGLFNRSLDPIKEVLRSADKKLRNINDIILIGGASAIPKIKQILIQFFGKNPFSGVNPLEAVAKGATITASNCKGGVDLPYVRGEDTCVN
jgi:molecular chaperone DnaK